MVMQGDTVSTDDPSRVTPILTDLWRRTQPIIRYRLGDILQLDMAPCRCGSTWQRIAAIEGRQDDLCWFPQSDDSLRAVFPDAIRRMVLLADAQIAEYRAEQPEPGALSLQVVVRPGASFGDVAARLEQRVRSSLAEYGCHATAVTVCDGIGPLAPGMKRRRVVCSWKRNAARERQTT
jgi:phenylacetate-CoA ligase